MEYQGLVADLLIPTKTWHIAVLAICALAACQVYCYLSSIHVDVPAVGVPPGIFGPWKAAASWVANSDALMKEGFGKYGMDGIPFKISTPARWIVFITNPTVSREIGLASEAIWSHHEPVFERLSIKYTIGKDFMRATYVDQVISKLTHSLTTVLPEVIEEMTLAFEENTSIGPEWTAINNREVMLSCSSRMSNRVFVGVPLCRKQDYLDKVIDFAMRFTRAGQTIDIFPWFLKGIVSKLVHDRKKDLAKVVEDVGPIFEERRQKQQKLGVDWTDKPNDAIQWIIDVMPSGSSIENMCTRLLFLNFAAVHTSSWTVNHVLLDLAACPEYQDPLKEEIELVLHQFGGWKKQALTQMKKLDSVLHESQRVNAIMTTTIIRKAKLSCRLSDGTFMPKGTWVMSSVNATHHSETKYEDPMKFDGFRFSRMREQPGHEVKYQAVSTTDSLAFGSAPHTCPGRFFAINQLKVLLAYIVCNYEFKTIDGKRPPNHYFGTSCIPNLNTQLLFRERADRENSLVNLYN